jgi:hypothetical protein
MKYLAKRCLLCICFLFWAQASSAQIEQGAFGYYADALTYFFPTIPVGTARIQALGGAQTALGADISAAHGNPAGLGLYNRSEFTLTPAFMLGNSQTNYIDQSSSDSRLGFTLGSVGAVLCLNDDYSKAGTVAISFMRTNNFRSRFRYEGVNRRSTMADSFVERANGINAASFDREADNNTISSLASLAYATFVISPFIDDDSFYYTEFRDIDDNLVGDIRQKGEVINRGGESFLNISYGTNFNDRFYVGVGLGIAFLNFESEKRHEEELSVQAADEELQSFSFLDTYRASGSGAHLSLGFIYRPSDAFRIGLSATTPTIYALSEFYTTTITARSVGFNPSTAETLPGEFELRMISPFKASAGIAAILGKIGFITADAEYVFYNGISFSGDDDFGADNRTIRNLYRPALNLRGGLEFRFNTLRLRGGASYFQHPLKQEFQDINRDNLVLSGGFGVRTAGYFVDLALSRSSANTVYNPYTLSNGDFFSATVAQNLWMLSITTGFNF